MSFLSKYLHKIIEEAVGHSLPEADTLRLRQEICLTPDYADDILASSVKSYLQDLEDPRNHRLAEL